MAWIPTKLRTITGGANSPRPLLITRFVNTPSGSANVSKDCFLKTQMVPSFGATKHGRTSTHFSYSTTSNIFDYNSPANRLKRIMRVRNYCAPTDRREPPVITHGVGSIPTDINDAKHLGDVHSAQHSHHKGHTHTTQHSSASEHSTHAAPPHTVASTPLNLEQLPLDAAFFEDENITQSQVPFYQISLSNGISTVTERKISKYELSYETGMPLRDLRPFTHQLNRKLQVAGLVTRPRSFLLNCEPLQAIVMPDRLQIFNVEPEDQPYMTALLRKLQRPSQAAFEHRSLECILSITVKKLEQEAGSFDERLTDVLNKATRDPSSQHLWDLREISDVIEAHGAYVRQTLSAITGVLSKDEFMNMMYLTRNRIGRRSNDHRDVELILEAAEDRLQALDHSCRMQQARITNAEQYLAVSNDTQRNEIIRVTLYATIVSLGFSAVSVLGSIFGMNLLSGLEQNPTMFWNVVLLMGAIFLSIILEGAFMIRKIDSDRPRSKAGRSFKF